MRKKEPLVSILVPCFNHEKFIGDCLNSIVSQDYDNIEVLVSDDCSIDKSWNIIERFEEILNKRFDNVILLKNDKNVGIVKNYNKLLKKASGELIKSIAGDDALTPSCISEFVKCSIDNPEYGVVVCNGYIISEEVHFPFNKYEGLFYDNKVNFSTGCLFERLYCDNFVFAPGVLLRRDIFEQFGYYDEKIGIEDWDYWLKLSKDNQVMFGYLNQCLVYYRKNTGSITSLTNNHDLERRRLNVHNAEMCILDKYGVFVSRSIYATQKWNRIESECVIAHENDLRELKRILKSEIEGFNMWADISLKRRLKIFLRRIRSRF